MKFYPTPPHIVDVVRKHSPRSVNSVLEPAVGEGALLDIFPHTLDASNLTLIDISKDRLNSLKKEFKGAKFVHSDFFEWASKRKKTFDLVVTNPPFSGKSSDWIEYEGKQVPIEVGFIDLCFRLLSHNGTLI